MTESSPLRVLLNTLPQVGQVQWIGVRPSRGEPVTELEAVQIDIDKGLESGSVRLLDQVFYQTDTNSEPSS